MSLNGFPTGKKKTEKTVNSNAGGKPSQEWGANVGTEAHDGVCIRGTKGDRGESRAKPGIRGHVAQQVKGVRSSTLLARGGQKRENSNLGKANEGG